ncbi:hypothetical protein AB0A70_16720 [Streptomyces morookaense]|uniref:hypothetical protein n=1 Tax=Streptomyces morookaense TaxID=1970 RepID=UPI0033C68B8B
MRNGFAGVVEDGRVAVDSLCSCGNRHRAAAGRPGEQPVTAGVFADAGRVAETWVCPRTGELGRGALSQIPLFYSVFDNSVRFSTDLGELAGETAEPWPAAVAAALHGTVLPAPLTPYENVFQLACGTTLTVTGGRERLDLAELDLAELADRARRLAGRSGPVATLRCALAHAGTAAQAGAAIVLGDGGGLGAAAIAAACGGLVRRVHVHVDVPVLERRRARLAPGTTVIDGTRSWLRACSRTGPGYAHEADPWPPGPELLPGRVRLLSGRALVRTLTGPPAGTGRLRTGWVRLTGAQSVPVLRGHRGWRAWLPPAPAAAPTAAPTAEPPAPADAERDRLEPAGWMSQAARAARAPVGSADAGSHLVPAEGAGATLGAVIDALESRPLSSRRPDGPEPVLVSAHPVVVGAIAHLALDGRLRRNLRGSHVDPVPLLRELVPAGWRPSDTTPAERDKLFAAAFVTRRLATAEQRARLLARVESSPWIDADRLKAVLADSRKILFDAPALHRLYVTAERYGEAMHTAVPQ